MKLFARDKKLPLTVLSGFLGAGKTTLLNHVKGINAVVSSESVAEVVTDHLNCFELYSPGKVKLTQDVIEITRFF